MSLMEEKCEPSLKRLPESRLIRIRRFKLFHYGIAVNGERFTEVNARAGCKYPQTCDKDLMVKMTTFKNKCS